MRSAQDLLRAYGLHLVLLLAIVAFVATPVIRAALDAPITPGARSYTELRRAELLTQGTIGYDPLRDELTIPTPYTFLLAAMIVMGVPWLLPTLLAIALLLLLYPILMRITKSRTVVALSLLAVLLSPTMSVLGTSHSPALLALVLLAIAWLLLLTHPPLAWIPLPFAIITSPVLGLLGAACVLVALARQRRLSSCALVLLSVLAGFGWFFGWSRSLPLLGAMFEPIVLSDVLFEFGNSSGVSVFYVILGAYGLLSPAMRKRPAIIACAIALFAATVFVPALVPVTALALAVLSGYGVADLLQRKWELELLRETVLLLVACAGLFLLIATVRERVDQAPTPELTQSLAYLNDQRRPGAVLSDPGYAPVIEYFTGRRAVLDALSGEEYVQAALYSRSSAQVYSLLEASGASHVLVTDEMLAQRFSRSDEGILFLLASTQRFVLVQQTESSRVWYYIPRRQGGAS